MIYPVPIGRPESKYVVYTLHIVSLKAFGEFSNFWWHHKRRIMLAIVRKHVCCVFFFCGRFALTKHTLPLPGVVFICRFTVSPIARDLRFLFGSAHRLALTFWVKAVEFWETKRFGEDLVFSTKGHVEICRV